LKVMQVLGFSTTKGSIALLSGAWSDTSNTNTYDDFGSLLLPFDDLDNQKADAECDMRTFVDLGQGVIAFDWCKIIIRLLLNRR
jgi:hypothetical protein